LNIAQWILVAGLRSYQCVVSPIFNAVFTPMGLGCRFHPTCSQYALEAVGRHGAARGSTLALKRVCRCHPWGGYGCDPVPPIKVGRGVPGERSNGIERLSGTPRPTSTC
jgi:putative membrane protein insertion efficiency factor